MTRALSIAFAVLLTTGCGSFTKGFEEGFDKSFRESCRASALKQGADQAIADRYCECALVKFKETKSMDQSTKACVAQLKANPVPGPQ
jgi:hypothetical protein